MLAALKPVMVMLWACDGAKSRADQLPYDVVTPNST